MNSSYFILFLVVFAIHFLVFSRLAIRTRSARHWSLMFTFACLTVSMDLRVWHPSLSVGPFALWLLFRWTAWGFTLLTVLLWWRNRRRNRRRMHTGAP